MRDSLAENRRLYLFLMILTIAAAIGLQGWRTVVNNFAVEAAGLDGLGMGVVQSVREIPGFLALLVVYLLFIISEKRLAALSVLVLGVGVAATGWFPSTVGLALTTLIMSFGFHYFETLNMSLTLQHYDKATAPLISGKLRGMASLGNLAIGGVLFLAAGMTDFKGMFLLVGGAVTVAGIAMLFFDPQIKPGVPQHRKMILRRRYWLFYALTFFGGARRQIFVAFSVFLLVERFGFSVREVTGLFILNNVINYFASPWIGRAITRFGERKVLSVEYFSLVFVFTAYAFSESKMLVACMYVVDHLVFNFAIAIRTYFQKIADPADIAPSMAVGFTINHIAAVVIPVMGGLAWLASPAAVFMGGAGLALVSLVLTQLIPNPENQDGPEA